MSRGTYIPGFEKLFAFAGVGKDTPINFKRWHQEVKDFILIAEGVDLGNAYAVDAALEHVLEAGHSINYHPDHVSCNSCGLRWPPHGALVLRRRE